MSGLFLTTEGVPLISSSISNQQGNFLRILLTKFALGSTAVGKLLYQLCAPGIKHIGLELGGNAPFIVFNSANIQQAVKGALASKFRNSGQTCVASNRFLIQEKVVDEFLNVFKSEVQALKLGDGRDAGVSVGPLISKKQFSSVSALVKDAVEKGANAITGGKPRGDIGELFFDPTILLNVSENMRLYREEIFGPVVPIIPFETEEEALEIANGTSSGLAAYFYSEDVSQIFRVGKALHFGMIGINEGIISTAEAPFGGVKESGLGREGSHHGIDEYTYMKYLCVGNLN